MSESPKRPPVKITFHYNIQTGEIDDLVVDDNAPHLSEQYHDKIARIFASRLARNPDIQDAGMAPQPGIIGDRIVEDSKHRETQPE